MNVRNTYGYRKAMQKILAREKLAKLLAKKDNAEIVKIPSNPAKETNRIITVKAKRKRSCRKGLFS